MNRQQAEDILQAYVEVCTIHYDGSNAERAASLLRNVIVGAMADGLDCRTFTMPTITPTAGTYVSAVDKS